MNNDSLGIQTKHTIGLVGQGNITRSIQQHLEESLYRIISLTPEDSTPQLTTCGLIVYCSDTWAPQILQQINRRCLLAHTPLLPVYTQFGEAIIGPCVVPDEKGCSSCAELHKFGATYAEAERELVYQYLYHENMALTAQPWLSSFSLEMLAILVVEEISAYFQRPDQLQTHGALLTISLETLDCQRHAFLPLSSCPDCGERSNDTAKQAVITPQSCLKPDAFTYRTQSPSASAEQIFSAYVDERVGLVHSLIVEHNNELPIASSQVLYEVQDGTDTNQGTGCTLCAQQSKVISVLESIERYAGLYPRSKRSMVQASYHQLIQQAQPVLDPTTLGLPGPDINEQHNHHHCNQHVPYHHDLEFNWVWGYSFQHQSPILVPEHCVYYGITPTKENPAFVYEISNGCALGNNLEEAIFHGCLEVVERDAFLLTWYAQAGLPRLDIHTVTDPTVRLLVERLEYQSGYTVYVWNATLDHAVPCLCLLGIDEQNREGMPKVHAMAGSHPHPEQALFRGLRELIASMPFSAATYQHERAQALEMLENSSLVKAMHDHPLVYYLPEAFDRLDFLCHTQRKQTFQEAFDTFYRQPPEQLDLKDDLAQLIQYYLKRGIDTIVVDQTAPEHIPCGLRCVKILMPGMLPMTFGQHNRRVTGFSRLHQLPYTLGYQDHPLTEAEINPHPHPFF
ncbi:TOMM precursor leader peptide-binding protein [Dictyobacter kobayashii]|uniref:SagD family biosynthesis docking scaffold protein n=1 Tax=Dictyobacter kobayashii TaxID=2014872 RepID=A0A402ATH5_9CHLR|nr:TOMM precursor leader peptide-binding protein [Dictyobacter kobayashii]GCE22394.1 SagD family biosynthesis docking scaffold protein [Dictyobacter kobayashii]